MLELLMKRRTIRKYKNEKVEKEKLDAIIKAALTSPSGRNKEPWQFILVDDEDLLKKLAKIRGGASQHIANAPLAIVVIADPDVTDVWIEDASIISTIIQLSAESMGLGSCWVQMRKRFDENGNQAENIAKDILNIPENYKVECIIPMGYPDEVKKPHNEKDLSMEKVHYNSFL